MKVRLFILSPSQMACKKRVPCFFKPIMQKQVVFWQNYFQIFKQRRTHFQIVIKQTTSFYPWPLPYLIDSSKLSSTKGINYLYCLNQFYSLTRFLNNIYFLLVIYSLFIENLRNNYLLLKYFLGIMQKLTRHRKAFYEKENDYKNGNQRIELHKSFEGKFINSSLQHYQSSSHHKASHIHPKKEPKNETEHYCEIYNYEMLNNYSNFQTPPKFLENHKIDSGLRARMLDWMVQVMRSYKFTHKAYFAGVQLMDRYFQNQKEAILPIKLHIIGVVSMMVASKMEEVYPLKLKTVFEKIAHKKITEQQLVNLEERITYCLNFKLNSWTFFDLALAKIHILIQVLTSRRMNSLSNITNNYFSLPQSERTVLKQIQENLPRIEETLSYLSKFLIYDYDFYCSGSLSLFSDVILKLCFQMIKIPCQLQIVLTSPQISVQIFKQQLKQKIFKFDNRFKGITNLRKYTSQQIVTLVDKEICFQ